MNRLTARLDRLGRRLLGERRGNVAIIAALCMIPLTLAIGMGVDYTLQKRAQDQLAGIADAAALVAVTPTAMTGTCTAAATASLNFWKAQSATVNNVVLNTPTVTVCPDTTVGSVLTRNVTVAWSGKSSNSFAGVSGLPTWPLQGSSSAASNLAPEVNFYMLLDTSPSMGIVATTADMAIMVANTSQQGGCAFACHESSPASDSDDTIGNPKGTGVYAKGEDNYTLAKNLTNSAGTKGLPLRIDLVNYAVTSMLQTAAATATANLTTYGISISTIDYQVGQLYQTSNITQNLSTATSTVGTLAQLEVAYNNCIKTTDCTGPGGNDQDSYLDTGLSTLNTLNTKTYSATTGPGYAMYKPGNGTKNAGDSPQEVLFIISDGVVDETLNGNRAMDPINTLVDNCTKIKANGIRIAFLYLTYNPLPTNSFYNSNIASFQSRIGPAAQACASAGLYQEVATDQDVTAALNSLFQAAVATARLTH
ncbi:MAG: TadE/TadG family type IV pilus assembly protein [Caulobacteraceae bacterium]